MVLPKILSQTTQICRSGISCTSFVNSYFSYINSPSHIINSFSIQNKNIKETSPELLANWQDKLESNSDEKNNGKMRFIHGNPEARDLIKSYQYLSAYSGNIQYTEYTFWISVAFYMSNKIQMHGINCFLIWFYANFPAVNSSGYCFHFLRTYLAFIFESNN